VESSDQFLGVGGTNLLCWREGTHQIVVAQLDEGGSVIGRTATLATEHPPFRAACHIGRRLVAWTEAGESSAVRLASIDSPDQRSTLASDLAGADTLRFSQDGTHLLAGRTWQALRVWNTATAQPVVSIDDVVRAAVFAARGRILAVILGRNQDHEIVFHDLTRPDQPPRRIQGEHFGYALAVSPDGGTVAVSGGSGEVKLYDPLRGELEASLHGHLNATFGIAFSIDGRRLVSMSGGREAAKLWDLETRQELINLPGTGSFLPTAAWSGDGNFIAGGEPWQTWSAPSLDQIAAAESRTP
jgi:WD40 repeat protein